MFKCTIFKPLYISIPNKASINLLFFKILSDYFNSSILTLFSLPLASSKLTTLMLKFL